MSEKLINILIWGLCPSPRFYDPVKGNPSINRLDRWLDFLDVTYDHTFHNIIEHHNPSPKIKDVNLERVKAYSNIANKVLTLGGFVSNSLTKAGIEHFKLDHPSPLNRNLNDPLYEEDMLQRCKQYLEI